MDDRTSCEVHMAVSQAEVLAKLRQPPTTPYPVRKQGIHQHRHKKSEEAKVFENPAPGHRTGWDRGCRIHEDHLKQKQCEDSDVVSVSSQEETLLPPETKIFTK